MSGFYLTVVGLCLAVLLIGLGGGLLLTHLLLAWFSDHWDESP